MQPVDIDAGAVHFHSHENRYQGHLDLFHQIQQTDLLKPGHQYISGHKGDVGILARIGHCFFQKHLVE